MLRFDPVLAGLLLLLMGFGCMVLYSAGEQNMALLLRQAVRLGLGLAVMLAAAQVPPRLLKAWAVPVFAVALLLLLAVDIVGVGRGTQRLLDPGVIRFLPAEAMMLVLPLMAVRMLARKPLPHYLQT